MSIHGLMADEVDEWAVLRHRTYTLKEAAEALRVKPLTLWKLIRRGIVPAQKLGPRWRVPGEFVVDMMRHPKDSA